jgi:hypothetical protein
VIGLKEQNWLVINLKVKTNKITAFWRFLSELFQHTGGPAECGL